MRKYKLPPFNTNPTPKRKISGKLTSLFNKNIIVESTANPGESYYFDGTQWLDFYDYKFINPEWDQTAKFCIKGLANPWVPTLANLDYKGDLNWEKVKGGSTVEGSFTVKNIGEPLSCLDWEITEYPNWGSWDFSIIFL